MDVTIPRKVSDSTVGRGSPHEYESYYFAVAVSSGNPVVIDTATTTAKGFTFGAGGAGKVSTTAGDERVVGVADHDIVAGTYDRVVKEGVVLVLYLAGQLATAGLYVASSTTAGKAKTAANTDINVWGQTIEAADATTTNYVKCFVHCG